MVETYGNGVGLMSGCPEFQRAICLGILDNKQPTVNGRSDSGKGYTEKVGHLSVVQSPRRIGFWNSGQLDNRHFRTRYRRSGACRTGGDRHRSGQL